MKKPASAWIPPSRYLPELEGTNKADMVLRDIIISPRRTHRLDTILQTDDDHRRRRTRQRPEYYRRTPDAAFSPPL